MASDRVSKKTHKRSARQRSAPDAERAAELPAEGNVGVLSRDKANPRLLTVRQFADKHPAFTVGGLRFYIFNAQSNGFEKALVRLGRRVLLDEAKVFQWIDDCQERHG